MAAREVIGTNARQVVLDDGAIDELRARVRGRLIRRGDEGYDERRKVWNGMISRNPALIVECTGTADVIAAVNFARDRILPISVRGGGHNVAGTAICDGGVVIDLSRMNNVRVDPLRKTASVGGGATLGQVDHETQAFALAVPAGLMSRTGIAGLSLHGGLGALTRHYGLTCDNLIAADVVTADGQVLVVDKQNHSDMLWALRGGGGNFGVVTSFEFRLHPVGPEVWMAIVMYPVEKAARILRFFREHMAQAPDELMAIAVFWNTPPEEPMPEGARNVSALILFACYSGPFDRGESAIQPLREIDTPLADLSGPMPFLAAQQ
ncbi:MAG: FAD-binding oxidoreductase, partial [bacterium]